MTSTAITGDDATSAPLWTLEGVSVGRSAQSLRLHDVSIQISAGVSAVLGPSGSGKTTLIDLLCGLVTARTGRVDVRFRPEDDRLPLFWAGHGEGLWPHLTVSEQISDVGADPNDWLPRFELDERKDARPSDLSQGECSRLELARALAADPTTLLLDEPLTHVDRRRAALGWAEIERWVKRADSTLIADRNLILATHDLEAARRLASFVICLDRGRIVDAGRFERVLSDPATDAAAWAIGAEVAAD